MSNVQRTIELADRKSRGRAILTGIAAVYFLAIQPVVYPSFHLDRPDDQWRSLVWVVNMLVLLFLLVVPFVPFGPRRQLWALVNDDVTRAHSLRATTVGFWAAMAWGLLLCALQLSHQLSAREAIYLVLTPAVGLALLVFAWLEIRAHHGE